MLRSLACGRSAFDRGSITAVVGPWHKMQVFSGYLRYPRESWRTPTCIGAVIASKWASLKEKQWLVQGNTKRKPKHNSTRP